MLGFWYDDKKTIGEVVGLAYPCFYSVPRISSVVAYPATA
jgi:hypothetical protein